MRRACNYNSLRWLRAPSTIVNGIFYEFSGQPGHQVIAYSIFSCPENCINMIEAFHLKYNPPDDLAHSPFSKLVDALIDLIGTKSMHGVIKDLSSDH